MEVSTPSGSLAASAGFCWPRPGLDTVTGRGEVGGWLTVLPMRTGSDEGGGGVPRRITVRDLDRGTRSCQLNAAFTFGSQLRVGVGDDRVEALLAWARPLDRRPGCVPEASSRRSPTG